MIGLISLFLQLAKTDALPEAEDPEQTRTRRRTRVRIVEEQQDFQTLTVVMPEEPDTPESQSEADREDITQPAIRDVVDNTDGNDAVVEDPTRSRRRTRVAVEPVDPPSDTSTRRRRRMIRLPQEVELDVANTRRRPHMLVAEQPELEVDSVSRSRRRTRTSVEELLDDPSVSRTSRRTRVIIVDDDAIAPPRTRKPSRTSIVPIAEVPEPDRTHKPTKSALMIRKATRRRMTETEDEDAPEGTPDEDDSRLGTVGDADDEEMETRRQTRSRRATRVNDAATARPPARSSKLSGVFIILVVCGLAAFVALKIWERDWRLGFWGAFGRARGKDGEQEPLIARQEY